MGRIFLLEDLMQIQGLSRAEIRGPWMGSDLGRLLISAVRSISIPGDLQSVWNVIKRANL
jgi:hypothetical protein